MSDTRSRPDETMDDAPRPFKKRAYGYSCLPCRETNTVCMAAGRKAPKKRDPVAETQRMDDFERRLRRLEALAKVSSRSRSRTPPQKISSAPRTQQPSWASSNPDHEDELGRPQYDLGSAARPVYHGELSMFDEPDQRGSLDAPASSSPLFEGGSPQSWTEDQLRAAARLRHRYAKAEEGEVWVDAYFSWASPVYAVVHRPIFIRDMALDGPYFSDFLLIIIYITGIRLTYGMDERERIFKGEQFVSLAMNMLAEETMGPPRIPTIQALIGLAGRQSAVGKTNQAWMLTGMAIRMMQEMGLHLPVEDDSRFSPEDRDMRIRLFWSAYCWDKTMSLTLGREPSLLCRPGLSPDSLPADPDDAVEWTPHLPSGAALPLSKSYPSTKLLKTFTLRHSSKLNIILESILTNMYSPDRPNMRSLSFIRSAVDKLETWRRNLPSELRIEGPTLPRCSPPANVVILNLLYHTICILIYRPLLTSNNRSALASSALNHCRNAAMGTHEVLSLWGRTFGHSCHHYLILYCCFISAGVDILLIRTGNAFIREEAIQRVHLSLDILEQASSQGPGIKRGIMTIRTQLDLATKDDRTVKDLAQPASVEQTMGSALPQQQASTSTWLQADVSLDGALWDHQLLLDMLDSAPISTENPFSFGHGSNDGLWAL
ncbi:hypothetical protein CcaverHIS631_0500100 [Cutaneotrichosporon cavernicola]|nr:hypothetical protein CcaverHIS631_0500100 [Cutaneotrichosporon cavernicola]